MRALGIDPSSPEIRTREGRDETGNTFVRFFTRLATPVGVAGAPWTRRTGISTMFQRIIYDGLVGDEFLRRFIVTYDVPTRR
jgi:hypothetical protein